MRLLSLDQLRIDARYAPGWSLAQCRQRGAFLVKLDDDTVWVAAIDPKDQSIQRDFIWLTKRPNINVAAISTSTLTEAIQLFAGALTIRS